MNIKKLFLESLSKGVHNQIKINTAGGSPAASHLLLLRQKKVTEEKATPVCRPLRVFPQSDANERGCGTRATRSDSPRLNLRSFASDRGGAQGGEKQNSKTIKS